MKRLHRWLFTAVRKLYAAMLPAVDAPVSHMIEADLGGIHDGADYSRPVVIPGWMRRDASYAPVVEARLQEAASDYRSQFGDPYNDNAPIPNAASEDPLREWDWSTRERVLSNCHAVYQRNPLANSIVQFTADFVVGDGFNLSTKNPDVEQVLMDFINHEENAIREYERQAVIDLQVDGELVIQLFKGAGDTSGQLVIAPRRPWELRYIKTEMGFYKRVEQYQFNRHEQEGDAPSGSQQTVDENIPADQIIFVALNRHSYELRGRPELYRLLPWLRADTEWLSDRARQSKWRNALLWIVRVAGNAAQIGAILQQWRKPPAPGSAYVSSDRVEVEAATNSANAGDASNDGRAIRLMSIMGARLPEYMFGDGSMANLATATKQELPALTKFETFQQIMIRQLWTPLFKQVIRNAIDAGELKNEEVAIKDGNGDDLPEEEGGGMCPCEEAFEVTYEPVTQQDVAQLTQALSTQAMNGWISDKSAQEKLGLDPHVEAKRIASEAEKKRDEMNAGLRPIPPGQEGAVPGMMDDDEEEPG